MMNDIDVGRMRRVLRENEGVKTVVYRDTLGHLTVGVGHLLPDDGSYREGQQLPDAKIEAWFDADLRAAYDRAERIFGAHWGPWGAARREAAVDFVFQCGRAGVMRFQKCVTALRTQNWTVAVLEHLDSRGAKQTPNRFIRRAQAWAYGEWKAKR